MAGKNDNEFIENSSLNPTMKEFLKLANMGQIINEKYCWSVLTHAVQQ